MMYWYVVSLRTMTGDAWSLACCALLRIAAMYRQRSRTVAGMFCVL